MTFNINISCDTAAEAIKELLTAAAFYGKHPELAAGAVEGDRTPSSALTSSQSAPGEKTTPVVPKTRTKKEEPKADPKPDATAADSSSAEKAATESSAASAISPSDEGKVVTIDIVRAFLMPYLQNPDKAPEVTAMIAEIGGAKRLSEVSIPNLAKLLAAAKEKFGG